MDHSTTSPQLSVGHDALTRATSAEWAADGALREAWASGDIAVVQGMGPGRLIAAPDLDLNVKLRWPDLSISPSTGANLLGRSVSPEEWAAALRASLPVGSLVKSGARVGRLVTAPGMDLRVKLRWVAGTADEVAVDELDGKYSEEEWASTLRALRARWPVDSFVKIDGGRVGRVTVACDGAGIRVCWSDGNGEAVVPAESMASLAVASPAEWRAKLQVGSMVRLGTRVGKVATPPAERSTEKIAKTAQGAHPYRNGMDTTDVLNFPAVAEIVVTFDKRCKTERNYDTLTITSAHVAGYTVGEIIEWRTTAKKGSTKVMWIKGMVKSTSPLKISFRADGSGTPYTQKISEIRKIPSAAKAAAGSAGAAWGAAFAKAKPAFAAKSSSSKGYKDAAGRPTLGDTVRLKVDKKGLTAGTLCTVMRDDKDSSPYYLQAFGSAAQKHYFTEAHVQKLVPPPPSPCVLFAVRNLGVRCPTNKVSGAAPGQPCVPC